MRGYDLLFAVAALAGVLKLWEEDEIHLWHFPALIVAYFIGRYLWKQALRIDVPDQPTQPDAPAYAPAHAEGPAEGPAPASQEQAWAWIAVLIALAVAGASFYQTIQKGRPARVQPNYYAPAAIPPPPPGFEIER